MRNIKTKKQTGVKIKPISQNKPKQKNEKTNSSKTVITPAPPKPKNVSTNDIFEEGTYSYFEMLVSNKSNEWILEAKSKKTCQVVVWLDKIDDSSFNLTIFPSSQESSFFDFPISTYISRFPTQEDNLPYKLSKFGIPDCDYALNYK